MCFFWLSENLRESALSERDGIPLEEAKADFARTKETYSKLCVRFAIE